jgi:hypothetical protein
MLDILFFEICMRLTKIIICGLTFVLPFKNLLGQNPIIQTKYTADPAPLDFSTGATSVDVNVASLQVGKIEIRIDKINGPLLCVVNVTATREGDVFKTITTPVKKISGVHDLYFVFRGKNELLNFDW